MAIMEMHVKSSAILADRFGPNIFNMLEIRGKFCISRECDVNALLVRKLPMFLSRLNEISGGRRKKYV